MFFASISSVIVVTLLPVNDSRNKQRMITQPTQIVATIATRPNRIVLGSCLMMEQMLDSMDCWQLNWVIDHSYLIARQIPNARKPFIMPF